MCPRCKSALDTPRHRYYECSALSAPSGDEVADTVIRTTAGMCRHAFRYNFEPALLWFRGVLPAIWSTSLLSPPTFTFQSSDPSTHMAGGWSYSDGAGPGKNQNVPNFAKRVGAGAAVLHWEAPYIYTQVWFGLSSVPLRQTVPRAEVQGMSMCLQARAKETRVDATYTLNGVHSIGTLSASTFLRLSLHQ